MKRISTCLLMVVVCVLVPSFVRAQEYFVASNITRGLIQGGNGREQAEKGGKQGV